MGLCAGQIGQMGSNGCVYERSRWPYSYTSMSETPQQQKIERIAQKYGVEEIGDELVAYWIGDGPDKSVRELAAYFNFQIVDTALRNAGIILDREVVESIAEKLQTDDARFTETEFGDRDVDLSEVKHDLVSYQSVHTYLREIREVEKPDSVKTKSQRIDDLRKLHARVVKVSRGTATQLIQRGDVEGPAPRIEVDATALCLDCQTETNLLIYLHNGGCPSAECSNHP